MNDGLSVAFADRQLVLQSSHHVCHFREMVKVLQLLEHFYGFFHDLIVVFRQRHVEDGIVGVCIAVVFAIIHLYRGIVAQLVTTHDLQVCLHGSQRHTFRDAFHVIESIAASIHQVVDGPSAILVSQAIIYCLVPYQGIFVCWHKLFFLNSVAKIANNSAIYLRSNDYLTFSCTLR